MTALLHKSFYSVRILLIAGFVLLAGIRLSKAAENPRLDARIGSDAIFYLSYTPHENSEKEEKTDAPKEAQIKTLVGKIRSNDDIKAAFAPTLTLLDAIDSLGAASLGGSWAKVFSGLPGEIEGAVIAENEIFQVAIKLQLNKDTVEPIPALEKILPGLSSISGASGTGFSYRKQSGCLWLTTTPELLEKIAPLPPKKVMIPESGALNSHSHYIRSREYLRGSSTFFSWFNLSELAKQESSLAAPYVDQAAMSIEIKENGIHDTLIFWTAKNSSWVHRFVSQAELTGIHAELVPEDAELFYSAALRPEVIARELLGKLDEYAKRPGIGAHARKLKITLNEFEKQSQTGLIELAKLLDGETSAFICNEGSFILADIASFEDLKTFEDKLSRTLGKTYFKKSIFRGREIRSIAPWDKPLPLNIAWTVLQKRRLLFAFYPQQLKSYIDALDAKDFRSLANSEKYKTARLQVRGGNIQGYAESGPDLEVAYDLMLSLLYASRENCRRYVLPERLPPAGELFKDLDPMSESWFIRDSAVIRECHGPAGSVGTVLIEASPYARLLRNPLSAVAASTLFYRIEKIVDERQEDQ